MGKENVISIKNLEKYQHYKDRSLVWFKWHVDCLNDYKFSKLKSSEKWIFIGLICLACKSNNLIPYDLTWLSTQLNNGESIQKELEALLASDLLATCYQNASPIREEEIREEKIREEHARRPLADNEFLEELRKKFAYVDLDTELNKMDAWLLTRPERKKTRRFIVNWLNKIDRPIKTQNKPKTYTRDTTPAWLKEASKKIAEEKKI